MKAEATRRYVLRALAVVACLAALADLRPLSAGGDKLPVAIVDVSRSVGKTVPGLPAGLRADRDWVLVAGGVQDVVGGAGAVRMSRGETRLGAALRHVAATRAGSDVVLISDGRGTAGDALAGARRVAAEGGRVFTMPPAAPMADAGLERAWLVAGGPEPVVRVVVSTSTSGRAEVRLLRDGRVADRRTIRLVPGEDQKMDLSDADAPSGGGSYQVSLEPAPGTPEGNREDDRLTLGLRTEERVVLLWGMPESLGLEAPDGLVLRASAEPAPDDLPGADAVVLANLPWRDVGREGAAALERFSAGGGSVLVLGGSDAYAAGGWAGTPLEVRVCPLRVPRQEGTGLGLVLALDRSGSTTGTRLAHLKDACRRALQGMIPGERMAVLPFAARPDFALLGPGILTPGDAEALAATLEALDAVEAGGDTDLAAAILGAARRAAGIEARERRVLLLTDGDPEHPPDAQGLRAAGAFLRDRGIGFGALVVGDEEAAARLREHVATAPADVVLIERTADLPESLMHRLGALRGRTSMLGRPAGLTLPAGALPALALDPSDVHNLEAAADAGAEVILSAMYPDRSPALVPFAARRSIGAGTVVGLAWGPQLEGRRDRAAAAAALMPWIARLAAASDRGLAAELDGEELVVAWHAAAGAGRIEARSGAHTSALVERRPGLFRGPLPRGAAAGVRVSHAGRVRPLRLPARPAPEHRGAGVDDASLRAIAEAGGGQRLAAGEQPPQPRREPGVPLAPWLLLGACILLVVDRLWARPDGPTRTP